MKVDISLNAGKSHIVIVTFSFTWSKLYCGFSMLMLYNSNIRASISVFVSILHSESFGVSVIEAGACSKPVVVSNVGGLPEVVEENVTGYCVISVKLARE